MVRVDSENKITAEVFLGFTGIVHRAKFRVVKIAYVFVSGGGVKTKFVIDFAATRNLAFVVVKTAVIAAEPNGKGLRRLFG